MYLSPEKDHDGVSWLDFHSLPSLSNILVLRSTYIFEWRTFIRKLGFMVCKRGIEIDPVKIRAIMDMPPLKNWKELRGLIGRLQFIRRFAL